MKLNCQSMNNVMHINNAGTGGLSSGDEGQGTWPLVHTSFPDGCACRQLKTIKQSLFEVII